MTKTLKKCPNCGGAEFNRAYLYQHLYTIDQKGRLAYFDNECIELNSEYPEIYCCNCGEKFDEDQFKMED